MIKIIVFLLLFATALPSLALPTDPKQPIQVTAERASIDDAKGVTVYQGNVVVTQGSTTIYADTVTLEYDAEHNVKVVHAKGKPARFERLPGHRQSKVRAAALRMEYHHQRDVIHLRDNARIHQGKDTFTGDKIRYDMKRDLITADGKISVTIQPKANDAQ